MTTISAGSFRKNWGAANTQTKIADWLTRHGHSDLAERVLANIENPSNFELDPEGYRHYRLAAHAVGAYPVPEVPTDISNAEFNIVRHEETQYILSREREEKAAEVLVEWPVNLTQMLLKQPPVGRPAGSWANLGGRWVRWVFESETDAADFLATVRGARRAE
jgi:hypothetical protein